MYLSRIEINQQRRETIKAMSSPQIMHGAVAACFPASKNEDMRSLWRVDRLNNSCYILLQSLFKPDCTHIVEQFGWPATDQTWETKEYGDFLSRLENGQTWHFRLTANPTHSVCDGDKGKRGKVFAHVSVGQQKKWLLDKAGKCGFELVKSEFNFSEDCPEENKYEFNIVQREIRKFKRDEKQKPVIIAYATFEGLLKIKDIELLRNTLVSGVGRAKAYGCGLLTLARP